MATGDIERGMDFVHEAKIVVKNEVGLHARPAAEFVKEAGRHKCSITIEASGKTADGKSIIQVLTLGVKCGQEIILRADGQGEERAVDCLVSVLGKEI